MASQVASNAHPKVTEMIGPAIFAKWGECELETGRAVPLFYVAPKSQFI